MGKSTGSVNKAQSVKKLPYDMTDEEIRKKVDADVASHFKKKAAPKKDQNRPCSHILLPRGFEGETDRRGFNTTAAGLN